MGVEQVCLACGQPDFAVLSGIEAGLFRCASCGTRFVEDFCQHDADTKFFSQDYINEKNCWLFEDYREPALRKIRQVLEKYAAGKKCWLDVGCATGKIFDVCAMDGMELITAVEPSCFGAARVRSLYPNVEVMTGDIDTVVLPQAGYDLCTVLDTLYFHPHPQTLLHKVSEALSLGGILICEVPNYNWLRLVGRVSTRGSHWKAYYDRAAIINVICANGYEILGTDHNVGNVQKSVKGVVSLVIYGLTRILYMATLGKVDLVPKLIVVACKVAG